MAGAGRHRLIWWVWVVNLTAGRVVSIGGWIAAGPDRCGVRPVAPQGRGHARGRVGWRSRWRGVGGPARRPRWHVGHTLSRRDPRTTPPTTSSPRSDRAGRGPPGPHRPVPLRLPPRRSSAGAVGLGAPRRTTSARTRASPTRSRPRCCRAWPCPPPPSCCSRSGSAGADCSPRSALSTCTTFMFLNTVFVWPKLLPAALLLLVIATLVEDRSRLTPIGWAAVAAAVGLGPGPPGRAVRPAGDPGRDGEGAGVAEGSTQLAPRRGRRRRRAPALARLPRRLRPIELGDVALAARGRRRGRWSLPAPPARRSLPGPRPARVGPPTGPQLQHLHRVRHRPGELALPVGVAQRRPPHEHVRSHLVGRCAHHHHAAARLRAALSPPSCHHRPGHRRRMASCGRSSSLARRSPPRPRSRARTGCCCCSRSRWPAWPAPCSRGGPSPGWSRRRSRSPRWLIWPLGAEDGCVVTELCLPRTFDPATTSGSRVLLPVLAQQPPRACGGVPAGPTAGGPGRRWRGGHLRGGRGRAAAAGGLTVGRCLDVSCRSRRRSGRGCAARGRGGRRGGRPRRWPAG